MHSDNLFTHHLLKPTTITVNGQELPARHCSRCDLVAPELVYPDAFQATFCGDEDSITYTHSRVTEPTD